MNTRNQDKSVSFELENKSKGGTHPERMESCDAPLKHYYYKKKIKSKQDDNEKGKIQRQQILHFVLNHKL